MKQILMVILILLSTQVFALTYPANSLTVDFTVSTRKGTAPLALNFISKLNNAVKWCRWDFGDGTTSKLCKPAHIYRKAGIYSVSLQAANTTGPVITIKRDYIQIINK